MRFIYMIKRIHILEDDSDIGHFIEFLLKNESYDLQLSSTFKEMKRKLKDSIPDLFILDVLLPDGNGLDICRDLKNDMFTQHIPVIVMSANLQNKKICETAKPDEYLQKPFDLGDIEQKIKNLLG